MEQKILKQIRGLQIYAVVSTVVFFAIIIMGFKQNKSKQLFEEIDVQRINIVEKNGALKLVISNSESQHSGVLNGKAISKRERPAGMIFFNNAGDECGGLVYDGTATKEAGMVFSVDQFGQDQIMQLNYSEDLTKPKRIRSYGLRIMDKPEDVKIGELFARWDSIRALSDKTLYLKEMDLMASKGVFGYERLFVGKTTEEEVGLFIKDEKGKPRIKIYINKSNQPVIEMLDANGKLVK